MGTNNYGSNRSAEKHSESFIRFDYIEKSASDNREYRGLKLENGMKVLLVSDPKTDISAAALSVQVGYMSDPDYLPGLAHFCEHMLFLGTEKYPQENGYAEFLSQNSGGCNATTYALMTKYYFYVGRDKLDDALDRFAEFFKSPLFTESATQRELNAVEAEHEKNLSNDIWRTRQLIKHIAKKDHAFSKFGSGNKKTLLEIPTEEGINVREELLKFYDKWYSSNIMSLAVVGSESLSLLEKMVVSKFSAIENKNVEVPSWPDEPFDQNVYGSKLKIVPIKDIRSLSLSFTTRDMSSFYKASPEYYLSHLIGHEAKGSILSELKRKGWCNKLGASHDNTRNAFGFFDISVSLTEEGLKHIDDIIQIIFQYFALLRKEGPQKWIFNECKSISEMHFRFKEKEKPVTLVTAAAASMRYYPFDEILSAPYMYSEWRPDLIEDLFNIFTPEKCRFTIVSKSFEVEANLIEPYYKTKFCFEKIPLETVNNWKNLSLNENLALPLPNAFIPTSFEVFPLDYDVGRYPQIIMESPILRFWHKQDHEFMKPKTCMTFQLSNPLAYFDPLHNILNHIMVTMFNDQMNEYLYNAELAGLAFMIKSKIAGIQFSIRGYSEKQIILLKKMLSNLFNLQLDQERFEIIKEERARNLKNLHAEQPAQHAFYYAAVILTENVWTYSEQSNAMSLVTFERLQHFVKEFFNRLHIEAFVYGNITQEKALEVVKIVEEHLGKTDSIQVPLLARQMHRNREYKLNNGDSYLFEKESTFHNSNVSYLYFQCCQQSDETNALVALLAQIMKEACYNTLRTVEQLGYIVLSSMRRSNGTNGFQILIQSPRHPTFVEDRIENFLETHLNTVENFSPATFNSHKESLIKLKIEKPKNVYEQNRNFHNEIVTGQYHFDRFEKEVECLRKITKEDLLAFYKEYIAKGGEKRKVLAVHIISSSFGEHQEGQENEITPSDRHTKIDDIAAFKSQKGLYPLRQPYIYITPKGALSN